jgi:hypothetical protein
VFSYCIAKAKDARVRLFFLLAHFPYNETFVVRIHLKKGFFGQQSGGRGIDVTVISCIALFNAYRNVSKALCELPLLAIVFQTRNLPCKMLTGTVFVDGM